MIAQIIFFGIFLIIAGKMQHYFTSDEKDYLTWLTEQPIKYIMWDMFNKVSGVIFILFAFIGFGFGLR